MAVTFRKSKARVRNYALYTPDTPAEYEVLRDGEVVAVIKGRAGHAGHVDWKVYEPGVSREVSYGHSLKGAKAWAAKRYESPLRQASVDAIAREFCACD